MSAPSWRRQRCAAKRMTQCVSFRFQTMQMFLGQCIMLLVSTCRECPWNTNRHYGQAVSNDGITGSVQVPLHTPRTCAGDRKHPLQGFGGPALCNLVGAICLLQGLNFTHAATYQTLATLSLVFTGEKSTAVRLEIVCSPCCHVTTDGMA